MPDKNISILLPSFWNQRKWSILWFLLRYKLIWFKRDMPEIETTIQNEFWEQLPINHPQTVVNKERAFKVYFYFVLIINYWCDHLERLYNDCTAMGRVWNGDGLFFYGKVYNKGKQSVPPVHQFASPVSKCNICKYNPIWFFYSLENKRTDLWMRRTTFLLKTTYTEITLSIHHICTLCDYISIFPSRKKIGQEIHATTINFFGVGEFTRRQRFYYTT